jgi:small subunit ribosomal protein S16
MVKIRLRRVGAKKQPSYRLVAADSRAPRDGRFIEEIGFYNPRTEPETVRINEERVLYWLSVGAQPTDSAARLLRSSGTLERFERLKQGEAIEVLVAEAEAEEVEGAEEVTAETPAVEAEAIEAEEETPEAAEEAEIEEAEEEAPEAVEGAEEATAEAPAAEEPAAETEMEEAEEGEPEPETSETEEEDEPEE